VLALHGQLHITRRQTSSKHLQPAPVARQHTPTCMDGHARVCWLAAHLPVHPLIPVRSVQFPELTLEQQLVLINAPIKTPRREYQPGHGQAEQGDPSNRLHPQAGRHGRSGGQPVSKAAAKGLLFMDPDTCDSRDLGGDKAGLQMKKWVLMGHTCNTEACGIFCPAHSMTIYMQCNTDRTAV
jgi:hypothetical protein